MFRQNMTLSHEVVVILALLFAFYNTYDVISKISDGFVNVTRSPYRKPGAKFDDGISGLAWFVQVSDLHFSIFIDENRSKDFKHLCKFIKHSIKVRKVLLPSILSKISKESAAFLCTTYYSFKPGL